MRTDSPTIAYLALGANLGDRAGALAAAAAMLDSAGGVRVMARSPMYETDAVADEPQPPYLNAVLRVETTLGPRELLAACLEVERVLGRVRVPGQRHASRTIDVDVLLCAGAVLSVAGLDVPHPQLAARPFVRIPLADVAEPGLRHPISGEPLDVAGPSPSVRRTSELWTERKVH